MASERASCVDPSQADGALGAYLRAMSQRHIRDEMVCDAARLAGRREARKPGLTSPHRRHFMFVAPGSEPNIGYRLSRDAAEHVARNWWLLLCNGALLIVAGFLIFSIDWTVRGLATFVGAVFIVQGIAYALTSGIDDRVRRANIITGLLSVAAGMVIIVWPGPGGAAGAVILRAGVIGRGAVTRSGAVAARRGL